MILEKNELSTRAVNVLWGAGVAHREGKAYHVDVDRLCQMTERDLIIYPGSGRKTMAEIAAWLEAKGLKLGSRT